MYEVFEQLLQARGITVADVCRETGVAHAQLSNWKRRKGTVGTKTLQKLADYFGVTVDFLMTGKLKEEEEADYIVTVNGTEESILLETYRELSKESKERLMEYAELLFKVESI